MEEILLSPNILTISLVTLSLVVIIALPLLTWLFKSKKTNWGNFWVVWFLLVAVLSITTTIMVLRPQAIPDFVTKIGGYIGW